MRTLRMVTIVVAVSLGTASAHGMAHGHGTGQQHHPSGGAGPAAMGMGMADARVAFDDEAGFLQHMIRHHQEAVESAEGLLDVGERDELLDLARGVVETQRSEIEAMTSWLRAWYPDLDREIEYEPMMQDLEGRTPDEAERSFIEGMIMHHRMAVRDARHLLMEGLAAHEEVETMARAIVADQMREIEQLQAWLGEWFAAPAAAGMGMMGPDSMAPMTRMHETMHGSGMAAHGHMMRGQGMMPGAAPMGMHALMQGCMRMMGPEGMGAMHGAMPMMGDGAPAAGFDGAGVEALARAFLSGRGVEGEIARVEPPRNVHRVTYRDGETEGVLFVDADTGVVTMEESAR